MRMELTQLPTTDEWAKYDWAEVLPGGDGYTGTYFASDPTGTPIDDMTAERISEIINLYAENPEGYGSIHFACIARLVDGQYASCAAWADTTGWDCQSGAYWRISPDYSTALMQVDEEYRNKFAVKGETVAKGITA